MMENSVIIAIGRDRFGNFCWTNSMEFISFLLKILLIFSINILEVSTSRQKYVIITKITYFESSLLEL